MSCLEQEHKTWATETEMHAESLSAITSPNSRLYVTLLCKSVCVSLLGTPVKNDVWSVKSINAETHDLRGKPLQCEGEKPRAPASNDLTISRVWVTRLRRLTRESSLHETLARVYTATGLRFASSEARPLS